MGKVTGYKSCYVKSKEALVIEIVDPRVEVMGYFHGKV